jgi:succinate dehydrogenase / fumarate reductase cytochrome b subunit
MRLIDALQYRLPVAGVVSILHRVSGVLMFVLLPFIVWLLDTSLSSEVSYARFTAVFNGGGLFPGWFVKLVALSLIWAYLHHFIAGVRHLWMDATHAVGLEFGRQSALFTLAASLLLTLVLGVKLFFF